MVESLWHADRKNLGDRMQMIQFMKNVSMSGGCLILLASGGGRISLDYFLRGKKK